MGGMVGRDDDEVWLEGRMMGVWEGWFEGRMMRCGWKGGWWGCGRDDWKGG